MLCEDFHSSWVSGCPLIYTLHVLSSEGPVVWPSVVCVFVCVCVCVCVCVILSVLSVWYVSLRSSAWLSLDLHVVCYVISRCGGVTVRPTDVPDMAAIQINYSAPSMNWIPLPSAEVWKGKHPSVPACVPTHEALLLLGCFRACLHWEEPHSL